MSEKDYDVVEDTLQKKIDALWKVTKSNMNMDVMNVMDDIRLDQIEELRYAIRLWKEYKRTV